jgi:Ca-activated chloride channel family protein
MDLSNLLDANLLAPFKLLHFLHPLWLLALPALWGLAFWMGWHKQADGAWPQVIDAQLLPALRLQSDNRGGSPWPLLVLAWTLAVVALAGPAWQHTQSQAFHSRSGWVFLLDLSPTMAATDIAPDRATRARYALNDLLDAAQDARVALIAFAGEAHTVTPLTDDVATVRALLPPLAPNLMPETGDAGAPALQNAEQLLHAAGIVHGDVILLSDGVDDAAAAFAQAQRLHQQGHRLHVIGIGTVQGAPLPDGHGGFLQDSQDRTRLTRLRSDQLRRLAELGGGSYATLQDLPQLLSILQADAPRALDANDAQATRTVTRWRNDGFWLLLPLLVVGALLARRGWL